MDEQTQEEQGELAADHYYEPQASHHDMDIDDTIVSCPDLRPR